MTKSLTAERLRELLSYDWATGLFTNLVTRGKAIKGTTTPGVPSSGGYLQLTVDMRRYQAHRLAWLWMTGEWPTHQIDHKDTDPANNRWLNLRPATQTENNANSRRSSANTSGFKGAHWNRQCGRWQGLIKKNGKIRHLGLFDAPEEAHAAYCRAANETFGEYARAA